MPTDQTPGARAYSAYRDSVGGRTHDNRPMPMWDDLPGHIRRAWECAAGQVRRDTLVEVHDLLRRAHGELGV